jgi:homoserine kinase
MQDDGGVVYRKFDWPEEWQITACIPNFELSTDIARSALPTEVPMKDAIFNNSHLAMLVTAVLTKDEELMKEALHDKLHQPYRMKLVPGLEDITAALQHEEGVLGCVLSGAGPSILVISNKNALDRIRTIVKDIWAQINVKAEIMHLAVEKHGAYIIKHED